ncbi:MAG: hypothetical protein CVU14_07780 [Bacteroidetes bacterium HGW-Bacteroidetes-9]|jgi:hypothetical protein|nr:MAG: hypothetical protein CVU14_07780 [Bacteroidetes bacterium HGW-Bacteroidetes-9]
MPELSGKTGKYFLNLAVLASLFVIPVILFFTSLDTIRERDKAWYGGGYDPEYAYLFNSLNMAGLRLAGHVDHPGTTMQVAGGVVLRVAWLIDPRGDDLTKAVLSDPEHYIRILNITVAVIGSLVLLLLGWFVTSSTGIVWYGLLLQLTPFISGYVLFNGFTRVTQEVMQMSAAFAMSALVLHWYFKRNEGSKLNYTIWFAAISGFGLASKIIFFPLLVIPLLLIDGWKQKFRFIVFSVLAFIIFTLPVIRMYPSMFKWIYKLFMHSGQYGSGSAEVIDSSKYFGDLVNLIAVNPYFSGLVLLSIAVLLIFPIIRLFKKSCPNPAATRVLAAVVVAQFVGYLLVAKQPKAAYLLSYECVSAVNAVIIFHLAVSLISFKQLRLWVLGLLTIPLAFATITNGLALKNGLYGTDSNRDYIELWGATTGSNQTYGIVFTNPGASPIAGLFFGNAYSLNRYVSDLQAIYPDYYILDAYTSKIIHWGGDPVSTEELFEKYKGNMLIMHTPNWVEPDVDLMNLPDSTGWKMVEVYNKRGKILAPVKFESDSISANRKIVFSSAELPNQQRVEKKNRNTLVQSNVGLLTYENAHTGHSCAVATAEQPYVFGFEENEIMPGEKFSAGVWVYGEAGNIALVGSGIKRNDFYVSSNKVIAEEASGWKKIALEFMVDKFVDGGIIKIYVWNKGQKPVFLDDFRFDRISPLTNKKITNE